GCGWCRRPGTRRPAGRICRRRRRWRAAWGRSSIRCLGAAGSGGRAGSGRWWRAAGPRVERPPWRGGRGAPCGPGRGSPAATAPLLRPRLFGIPAFAAGFGVLVAFAAGLQGLLLMLALWLQAGEYFSPLKAGLTALAFSAGAFALAPAAVPMALKY